MSIYKNIKGFVPSSLVDWDGKVASVIFLAGCNFKCKFCHNKELVLEPEKLKTIKFDDVVEYLQKNKDFVDGIVITGGEPCLYEDLDDLCRKIKDLGFSIKLETNGSNPEILKKLIEQKLVDYIAMDIKTSFEKYEEITNSDVDIDKIKESIKVLADFDDYDFRITLYPEIKEKELIEITDYLKKENANKKFFLQQFRNENCLDEQANSMKQYKKEEIEKFLKLVEDKFDKAGVRNL